MNRIKFLKQLIALPFGPFVVKQLLKSGKKSRYLLNRFYVAGFQYYEGPLLIEDISPNEGLALRVQPENVYDNFAVAVYRKGVMIGHVPRSDNKHISRLLQQGADLMCKVTEANPDRETWEMLKVEVYL